MTDRDEPQANTLRAYAPADEDGLVEVWLAATIAGQDFIEEAAWRAVEPEIRGLQQSADSWVVEAGGHIVAFVSVVDGRIGGLFTHPDHQDRGHGRRLVEHVHGLHAPIDVEVFAANERARAFYASCGFTEVGRHVEPATSLPALVLRLG